MNLREKMLRKNIAALEKQVQKGKELISATPLTDMLVIRQQIIAKIQSNPDYSKPCEETQALFKAYETKEKLFKKLTSKYIFKLIDETNNKEIELNRLKSELFFLTKKFQ